MNTSTLSLKEQWNQLKENQPKIRTKQAADELKVSEAELLASTCDGENCIRLTNSWKEIIESIESLGYVMALTRNEAAVHEKKGVYQNFKFGSHVGLVLDDNIDLRLFLDHWHFGFAATVDNPRKKLYSLQFFNQDGTAVHKVYLMDDERLEDYQQLIDQFAHADQSPGLDVQPLDEPDPERPDHEIDQEQFLTEWSELKDTHDFFPLLKKFDVKRTQALRIAEDKFTHQVDTLNARKMLRLASDRKVPIMVFVRSQGVIQIHSGPVDNIKITGDWVNVLDPEFNLHLRENLIDKAWVVKKPTEDGIVTSLELFDSEDNQIATFFGKRKPGNPELADWRTITKELIE